MTPSRLQQPQSVTTDTAHGMGKTTVPNVSATQSKHEERQHVQGNESTGRLTQTTLGKKLQSPSLCMSNNNVEPTINWWGEYTATPSANP